MVAENNGRYIVNIQNKIYIWIYELLNIFRLSQVGVVSYGSECPSHGVYARVTEVKHWIQFIAQEAEDTNCNQDVPIQQGSIFSLILFYSTLT